VSDRFVVVPAAYVAQLRPAPTDGRGGEEVLLQLRANTGHRDGHRGRLRLSADEIGRPADIGTHAAWLTSPGARRHEPQPEGEHPVRATVCRGPYKIRVEEKEIPD